MRNWWLTCCYHWYKWWQLQLSRPPIARVHIWCIFWVPRAQQSEPSPNSYLQTGEPFWYWQVLSSIRGHYFLHHFFTNRAMRHGLVDSWLLGNSSYLLAACFFGLFSGFCIYSYVLNMLKSIMFSKYVKINIYCGHDSVLDRLEICWNGQEEHGLPAVPNPEAYGRTWHGSVHLWGHRGSEVYWAVFVGHRSPGR